MATYSPRGTSNQDAVAHNEEASRYWSPADDDRTSNYRWEREIRSEENSHTANRLRSHTMTSAISFYAASNSDGSCPTSRPPSLFDRAPSTFDKRENAAKTLLSKGGRMLRKHGSKFSLSSLQNLDSEANDKFFNRPVIAHKEVEKHMSKSAVAAIRREELKRTISDPFDFQHVTHTDRVYLNSLERVPKRELISEFSALRAGQRAKPQLRGIRVEDLPVLKKSSSTPPESPTARVDTAGTTAPTSPISPLRPAPPPKDSLTAPKNARLPLTLDTFDNFSLPAHVSVSPLSPITPPRRQSSRRAIQPNLNSPNNPLGAYIHSPFREADGEGTESMEDLCQNCNAKRASTDKPLPGLPLVHAISTVDNSARQVPTVPLPGTALDFVDAALKGKKIKGRPVAAPQASSPFNKQPIFHSSQATYQDVSLGDLNVSPLRSPIRSSLSSVSSLSDDMVGQEQFSKYKSVNARAFNVDDWEGAIDYSWELAAENELSHEDTDGFSSSTSLESLGSRAEKRTDSDDSTSTKEGITPDAEAYFKAQKASNMLIQCQKGNVVTVVNEVDESISMARPQIRRLSGRSRRLGSSPVGEIESHPAQQADSRGASKFNENSALSQRSEPNLTASFTSDARARSGISQSSSQESIILSIASSIMGTKRSSNSSASLLELMPDYSLATRSIEEFKDALETLAESLQSIQEDDVCTRGNGHKSYPSYPSTLSRKTPHRRVQSLAKDFILRDPSKHGSARLPTHSRVPSASRIPIPTRKSSVPKVSAEDVKPPARRLRSATTTSSMRSRNSSQVLYSLFPAGAQI